MNGLVNLKREVDKETINIILHVVIPYEVALATNDIILARVLLEKKLGYYRDYCINIAKAAGLFKELGSHIESIIELNVGLVSDAYESLLEGSSAKRMQVVKAEENKIMREAGISAFI